MEARVFRDYIERYLDAVRSIRYGSLPRLQAPPFATLSHGGAGTAYALWRLGLPRLAQSWITAAMVDRSTGALITEPRIASTSYLFGSAGRLWVQARLGRGRVRELAIRGYIAAARVRTGSTDFASGTAGLLVGATLILGDAFDSGDDIKRELETVVSSLRRSLAARLRDRVKRGWRAYDAMRFAHGWSGIVYALLADSSRRLEQAPEWMRGALLDLVAIWSPTSAPSPGLVASWCNGAAGATLLWSKAFSTTRERRFLTAAREAARTASSAVNTNADLCCGGGGVAYALFAIDRIDPGQGWRERAGELAMSSIQHAKPRWPNGLHRGHPGLVCLALDCLAEHPLGFPALEA